MWSIIWLQENLCWTQKLLCTPDLLAQPWLLNVICKVWEKLLLLYPLPLNNMLSPHKAVVLNNISLCTVIHKLQILFLIHALKEMVYVCLCVSFFLPLSFFLSLSCLSLCEHICSGLKKTLQYSPSLSTLSSWESVSLRIWSSSFQVFFSLYESSTQYKICKHRHTHMHTWTNSHRQNIHLHKIKKGIGCWKSILKSNKGKHILIYANDICPGHIPRCHT